MHNQYWWHYWNKIAKTWKWKEVIFSWGPTTVFRLVFGKHLGKCYDKMIKQIVPRVDTKIHLVLHSCYVKRLSRRQKKQEESLGAVSDSALTLQRSKQGLRVSKGNSDFNTLSSPWGLNPVINNNNSCRKCNPPITRCGFSLMSQLAMVGVLP